MAPPEASAGTSSTGTSGGTAAAGTETAARPCGTKEACSFLNRFANTQRPAKPNFPVLPDPVYWLDTLYRGYCELYLAVARLERKEYNLQYNPNDSIVSPPGPNPPPDKSGCPPPPGFP